MKVCPNCNRQNPDNSVHCSSCGRSMTNNSALGPIAVIFGGSSILAIGFIFIVIILVIALSSAGNSGGTTTQSGPSNSGNTTNNNPSSSSSSSNNNSQPLPTRTSRPPTVPPQNSYWCDDLSLVKLDVGDNAKVVWMKVNLRSSPEVPQDYYANIVDDLLEGTQFTIIGGPECAHNGTWWKVRTSSGQIGWIREYTGSNGYLIEK